jgi:hypothetical protein
MEAAKAAETFEDNRQAMHQEIKKSTVLTTKYKEAKVPRKALRGGIVKSILKRPCHFLAINAHKMAPKTTQWLQERHCDAPTKGLAWSPSLLLSTQALQGRHAQR